MKKLLVLILLVFVCGFSYGQKIQKVRSSSGGMNHGERVSVNSAIKGVNDYITYRYPSVIDMAAQPKLGNVYVYRGLMSHTTLLPHSAGQAALWLNMDTIVLNGLTRTFYASHEILNFQGTTSSSFGAKNRFYRFNDFINSSIYNTYGETMAVMIQPVAGESSRHESLIANAIQINSYTPAATGVVQLGSAIVNYGYSSWDNYVTVDDVVTYDIVMKDAGINPDSIQRVMGIRNTSTAPLYGKEGTWVLYSEYGDIYSNGDLEFTGSVTQTQLTGALTDGAPTAAEINTITSLTPSTAGAGYAVTIADSDGSGLLYRIESDGTSWQYLVMTKAL